MEVGDTVKVYADPQTETKLLGEALLVEHLQDGLTFILDGEGVVEADVVVHILRQWDVIFTNITSDGERYNCELYGAKQVWIRDVHTIGLSASHDFIESDVKKSANMLADYKEDKFLEFDGIEAF